MTLVAKPYYGETFVDGQGKLTSDAQIWFDEIEQEVNDNLLGSQVQLQSYTVATLPTSTGPGGMIYVSDEAGGPVTAFSDETGSWRRTTDRAIVS